jgi:hypothetical protein
MRFSRPGHPAVLAAILAGLLLGPAGLLGLVHADLHSASETDGAGHEACLLCDWASHSAIEPGLAAPGFEGPAVAAAPGAVRASRPAARPIHPFRFQRGPPALS